MNRTKLVVLFLPVIMIMFVGTFHLGRSARMPEDRLPWCYELTAAPEDKPLLFYGRTHRFDAPDVLVARRFGAIWFAERHEIQGDPAPMPLRPISSRFVAWCELPPEAP